MILTYNKAINIGVERHFPFVPLISVKFWAIISTILRLLTKCNSTGKGTIHCINRTTCNFGLWRSPELLHKIAAPGGWWHCLKDTAASTGCQLGTTAFQQKTVLTNKVIPRRCLVEECCCSQSHWKVGQTLIWGCLRSPPKTRYWGFPQTACRVEGGSTECFTRYLSPV